jgi:hypothetical protein
VTSSSWTLVTVAWEALRPGQEVVDGLAVLRQARDLGHQRISAGAQRAPELGEKIQPLHLGRPLVDRGHARVAHPFLGAVGGPVEAAPAEELGEISLVARLGQAATPAA